MRGEVGKSIWSCGASWLSSSAGARSGFLRPLRGRASRCCPLSVGALRNPRLPSFIPSGSLSGGHREAVHCWSPAHREAVKEGSRGSRSAPPERRPTCRPGPGGVKEASRTSIQVSRIVLHPGTIKHFDQLLSEHSLAMMFFLVFDVSPNLGDGRWAERKDGVPVLPLKGLATNLLMDPSAGRSFQLPHEVSNAMRGLESDEQVDVIFNAADRKRDAGELTNDSTQVSVHPISPIDLDPGLAVLGGEGDVVAQAVERRHGGALGLEWQVTPSILRRCWEGLSDLRPLRGRDSRCDARSVGALRDPRLPSLIPSGSLRGGYRRAVHCWSPAHRGAVEDGSRGSRSAPPGLRRANERDPGGVKEARRGAVLILVVMLLFALLAIAGLLIDIGMARLTQAHMQSVSDAAAIEGGWQMAMGADETMTRDAVIRRAAEMSESWGPHRIELEDGYDLNDDEKPESSQTINRDSLGDPVRPMLDPNAGNDIAGDIVLGEYVRGEVPDDLPGLPIGYDRSPAFEPNDEDPNSILVRLRRTGEEGIAGGTSAERLTYLWSRGSLLDLSLKGDGIAVRSETIAKLAPVVAIGDDAEGLLPTALDAAIPLSQVTAESYDRESLMDPVDPKQIGTVVENDEPTNPEGIGYLPIAKELSSGQWQVIGFMFAEVTGTEVRPVSLDESGCQTANASASFLHVVDLSDELIHENRTLTGEAIARAPVLVRSQQIHGGTP